jgi:hypothetical protein
LVLQKSKTKWPHALSDPRSPRSVLTNDSDHGSSKQNIANAHPQVNNLQGTENVSAGINEIPSSSSSYASALTDGKKIRNSSRNHSTFSQAINLRRGEKVSTMFLKKKYSPHLPQVRRMPTKSQATPSVPTVRLTT